MAGFGYINTGDFPYIFSYADAAKREAKIVPIRGNKDKLKPLGKRTRKWLSIRREEQTQDIIIRQHHTDVIRYRSNGDVIINNGGWPSPSTHCVMNGVLNINARIFNGATWITGHIVHPDGSIQEKSEVRVPNRTDIVLKRVDNGNGYCYWHIYNAPVPFVHRVKRKEANRVRAGYADFLRYLSGVAKVRTELQEERVWNGSAYDTKHEPVICVSKQELLDQGVTNNTDLRLRRSNEAELREMQAMMQSGDHEQWYKAAVHLVWGCYPHRWIRDNGVAIYPKALDAYIKQLILFLHRDEVLERVEVRSTHATRDRYGDWF